MASAHLAPHTWTVVVEGATGGQGGTSAWATGQNTPVQGGSPPSPVPLAPALSPGSPEAARQAWGAAGSPGQVSASSDSHPWAPGASPQPWGSCSRPRFRLITASRRGCWGHPAPRLRKPELPLIPNNTSVVQAQALRLRGWQGPGAPERVLASAFETEGESVVSPRVIGEARRPPAVSAWRTERGVPRVHPAAGGSPPPPPPHPCAQASSAVWGGGRDLGGQGANGALRARPCHPEAGRPADSRWEGRSAGRPLRSRSDPRGFNARAARVPRSQCPCAHFSPLASAGRGPL